MAQRTSIAFMALVAALALATPALAGGWAVVTLDALPREVHAGEQLQLGFVVRQHGTTPTNIDLEGKPLKPVLHAQRQDATGAAAKSADSLRVEARQDGAAGHFVADVTFPSDGVWAWRLEVPTYYIQDGEGDMDDNVAIFAPLTVLPAAAPAQPAVATPLLGASPAMLRWGAALLLLLAAGVALYARRGSFGRRRAARPQSEAQKV